MPGVYDPVFNPTAPGEAFTDKALAAEANKDVVRARHPEWTEKQLRWRWLCDSLEGGDRYRQAVYGYDFRGKPVRNLIRHKREYPDPRTPGTVGPYSAQPVGSDQAMPATDDDYEMRRARTPVPTFVPETIDKYLGKIFGRKVKREFPESPDYRKLQAWTADVDGKGTGIDAWMCNTVGRLLLACGNLDVLFHHPATPEGEEIRTHADELRLNVLGAVARVVLPQNVVYWELDSRGRYTLAVVQEWSAGGDADPRYQLGQIGASEPFSSTQSIYRPECRYRVWTPEQWVLYDAGGARLEGSAHPFRCVPMVRLFTRRAPRAENVGESLVESIAERQREYYNRDSELILSDTLQAHPIVQAPEDVINPEGEVSIGPGWMLPKPKSTQGGTVSYEPWEVLEFPKGGAESIRLNKSDIRDDVDRDAGLTKPAGAAGSNGTTVAQSGVSKEIDQDEFHNRLCSVSKILQTAEPRLLNMALVVLTDGSPPARPADGTDPIEVEYPTQFHLNAPDQIAKAATDFQTILASAGEAPDAEAYFLCELFRKALPGMDDEAYDEIDDEIEAAVKAAARRRSEQAEMNQARTQGDPELGTNEPTGPSSESRPATDPETPSDDSSEAVDD